MARGNWVFDPHIGGGKITDAVRQETVARIERHAAAKYAGRYTRLDIRFRGSLCYIDAFTEPEVPSAELLELSGETAELYRERLRSLPTHLCRLRFFSSDRWSVAFYTYSHNKYEPTFFESGSEFGTPEQGFDIGAVYLTD